MIGRIRLVVALGWVAASTLVLVPLQLRRHEDRLWSEWRRAAALAQVERPCAGLPCPVSRAN